MKDSYGRSIQYLRISITQACNHQCFYCRDNTPVSRDELSLDDIVRYTRALIKNGVRKVRITGGEPLLREDCVDICRAIKGIDGLKELCITTNASRLERLASKLKDAGVDRINISLNTLKKDTFQRITPLGNFDDVIRGFESAKSAGFRDVKLNVVLMKGINDSEIIDFINLTKDNNLTVRFIEFMPIGIARDQFDKRYIPSSEILKMADLKKVADVGVSQVYKLSGAKGRVGLINPVSCKFCADCNRVRLTSDAKLRMCLHNDMEIDLKGLYGDELDSAIREAILKKPYSHNFEYGSFASSYMNTIGG